MVRIAKITINRLSKSDFLNLDWRSKMIVSKFFTFILLVSLSMTASLAKSSSQANKVAALAIDRDNGFYYGFSVDSPTRGEAERSAIDWAKKYGAKNPSIVLVWSGGGCGVYRTVSGEVGTAYGWGVANTKEKADAIATSEALKRSNGNAVPNFVWACNTNSKYPLKKEYDAGSEIIRSVKIKDQTWALDNLQIDHFRNGDVIPHTMNVEEFKKWTNAKKPGSFCYTEESCMQLGKIYNSFALLDPRGIAPEGWRIPSKADFEKLTNSFGGTKLAGRKLRVQNGWPEWATRSDNASGFSALPGFQRWTGSKEYWAKQAPSLAQFWTNTLVNDRYIYIFSIKTYENEDEAIIGNQGLFDALPIRLIK